MRDELRESLAFLPWRSDSWIRIAKPSESRLQKFVCGRSLPTGALSVEGPTKNDFRTAILFSGHPSEPMVNERGFSDPSPGNDCNDVDIVVCPCTIQKSDILLSTKNVAPGNGQSGYGNLLRCKSWQLAGSDTRSGRGRLQEALTRDSTPCVDSAPCSWHGVKEFGRVLEPARRVFLQQDLQENNNRLRDMFEFFE